MKMKLRFSSALLACALAAFTVQPALAAPHTPKAGSKERKAIMDAMRKVVGRAHKKKIVFVVSNLNVEKGWAYFTGDVEYADGTRLSEEFVWGNLAALLRLEKKGWSLKHYAYHGDVIEPEFIQKFPQAPKSIFKLKN